MTDQEIDEVGDKFCKSIAILTNQKPDSCMAAWQKMKSNAITEDTFNEYLNSEYGDGNARKVRDILLTIINKE
jgi:hypothetical protein